MTISTHNIDIALVTISWIVTISFTLLAPHGIRSRRKSALVFTLFTVLIACVCAFAVVTQVPPWFLPAVLYRRFFDGTYFRVCLLLFWLLCSLASLLFISIIGHKQRHHDLSSATIHVGTVHRKFFHLTASLVTATGLFYDPALLALCVHLLLQIFIILELFRSLRVQPFCYLDYWLLFFIDGCQESPEQIITPILLLTGLNLPVLLDFRILARQHNIRTTPSWTIRQWHFAGLISIGVGDSAAAIFGSKFGRIHWHSLFGGSTSHWSSTVTAEGKAPLTQSNSPHQHRINTKTAEGSLAMFIAQIVVAEWLMMFSAGRFPTHSWQNDSLCCSMSGIVPSLIAALIATLVEASLCRYDNIIVPLCSMFTYWLFGLKD